MKYFLVLMWILCAGMTSGTRDKCHIPMTYNGVTASTETNLLLFIALWPAVAVGMIGEECTHAR